MSVFSRTTQWVRSPFRHRFGLSSFGSNYGSSLLASAGRKLLDFQLRDGGKLYSDETEAYKTMWNNSFKNGKPIHENFAWITHKGVLVLPSGNNENDEANTGAYEILNHKGKRYIQFDDGRILRVLASVHTHPNGYFQKGSDTEPILNRYPDLPMFTIGTKEVWATQLNPQTSTRYESKIGTQSQIFGGVKLSNYVNTFK